MCARFGENAHSFFFQVQFLNAASLVMSQVYLGCIPSLPLRIGECRERQAGQNFYVHAGMAATTVAPGWGESLGTTSLPTSM